MNLPHIASRIFGTPLLINRPKLDVILSVLGPRLGVSAPQIDAANLPAEPKVRKPYQLTADGIAVISAVGPLVHRQMGSALSGGPTTYMDIESEFMDACTDPKVNGIVMEFDSPGGEAGGCFELATLIASQRGCKPICGFADTAFSACYALAAACDHLIVSISGGVGSIGVVAVHADQSAFDEKTGVKYTYITSGARKADFNEHAPLSDEATAVLKSEIDRLAGIFFDSVACNRGMNSEDLRGMEAGLYFGENAVSAGLADQVGTFTDALACVRGSIEMGSSVAVATSTNSNIGASMAETKPAGEHPAVDVTALVAEAEKKGYGLATKVVAACKVAGVGADVAFAMLERNITSEAAGLELLAMRVAGSGPEVHSSVLPGDGANANAEAKPEKSLAARMAEKFGRKGAR